MGKLRRPLQIIPAAMDGEFLQEVLDELDTARTITKHERRKFARHLHRCLRVVLIVSEVGGEVAFVVATRNVSQGGVCFLHRQMMYSGEQCKLVFPLQEGKHLLVPARTIRCQHIRGVLHEIGVRFTRPLGLNEFSQLVKQGEESLEPYLKEAVR